MVNELVRLNKSRCTASLSPAISGEFLIDDIDAESDLRGFAKDHDGTLFPRAKEKQLPVLGFRGRGESSSENDIDLSIETMCNDVLAIEWSVKGGSLRNVDSARVSIPSTLTYDHSKKWDSRWRFLYVGMENGNEVICCGYGYRKKEVALYK
uniref:Uncharacterized protein n=1 Tax=Cucumis melo TaxID=3656 RepID=A0A9I9EGP4_CUCME